MKWEGLGKASSLCEQRKLGFSSHHLRILLSTCTDVYKNIPHCDAFLPSPVPSIQICFLAVTDMFKCDFGIIVALIYFATEQ